MEASETFLSRLRLGSYPAMVYFLGCMKKLVLGTGNEGKTAELRDLLGNVGFKIVGLGEFDPVEPPVESGATFAENAAIKASYYARSLGTNVLADDSGLEVTALGGRPGVFSARFAGENADDTQNNEKLLKELSKSDSTDRSSRFVCEMALADATGKIVFRSSGVCSGTIAHKPSGFNGFGYDPLFTPDGFDKTFGDLPKNIKKSHGHRAKAASGIARFLKFNQGLLT